MSNTTTETTAPETTPAPEPAWRPDPVRPANWSRDDGPWDFPDLYERTYGRDRRRQGADEGWY